ncbi:hypothetical protein M3F57_04700 [Brachybacterium muris]|uniref:hypothetical protein n=1 Tax=Brachybacterium muris TaxID=219301 RepID=UPI00223B649A|nr:hypothetical protein [Brachybacterium muris]MCT2295440.1 hypothetical protein [Brachybacterium muris]
MTTPPSTPSTYDWDTEPDPTAGNADLAPAAAAPVGSTAAPAGPAAAPVQTAPSPLMGAGSGPAPSSSWAHSSPSAGGYSPEPPHEIDGFDASHPVGGARPWTAPKASKGFPAWAVVAIVAMVLLALLAGLGLLVSAVRGFIAEDSVWVEVDDGATFTDGVVTDTSGNQVTDGTGMLGRPATAGEHTFSWPTTDGGTISVHATSIDPDATVPLAGGVDVLQPGYQLVVMTLEVTYEGDSSVQIKDEVWVWAETDLMAYPEVAGLVPNPLSEGGALADGQTLTVAVAVVVPEDDLDTLQFSVETLEGVSLYYGVPR